MISHWDEVEAVRHERGHIAGEWQSLTGTASVGVGVQRIRIDAGMWATPLHLEGSEEEIFYVLAGDGISLQWDGEQEEAFAVGPDDCLVHLALEHAHTLRAGDGGLDVLAFGHRHYAANTLLPRAGVSWLGPTWVLRGEPGDHPWVREAAAGAPEVTGVSPRPPRIVAALGVETTTWRRGSVATDWRNLGVAAGSLRTGVRHARVAPGALMVPPHCHSAEEEIFVVLEGDGTFELWPSVRFGGEHESHPVRRGTVVARPAGTGRAHTFRAGPDGLTVLAYGTREPNDIAYYPRSGKVSLRGIGVIGRLEQLDYWDGEE